MRRDSKGRFIKGASASPENQFKKGHMPWNKGRKVVGMERHLGKYAEKGVVPWNKGKSHMQKEKHPMWKGGISSPSCPDCGNKMYRTSKYCRDCYPRHNQEKFKKAGKLGLEKRWSGHIKSKRRYKYKYQSYKDKYPNEVSLIKKRFTNQRYKARKKGAIGNHTFKEWENLKTYYQNMCLCCKRQEPEIKLTEDHIVPLSKGGTDYIENIQPLCVSCNTHKFTRTINYLTWEGGEEKRNFHKMKILN